MCSEFLYIKGIGTRMTIRFALRCVEWPPTEGTAVSVNFDRAFEACLAAACRTPEYISISRVESPSQPHNPWFKSTDFGPAN